MRKTLSHLLTLCVLTCILTLSCWPVMPIVAQSGEPVAPANGLQIEETTDGITFAWSGQVQSGPNAPAIEDASGQWRTIEIGDRLLPAQLVSVVVEDSAQIVEGKGNPKSLKQSFAPAALVVESAPWAANLPFVNIPIPQSSTGETYPDMARTPNPALPNAPIIVLREGFVRNLHLAVLAVTPIYQQDGVARAATRINATVRGVRLLKDQNEILGQFDVNGAGREPLRSLAISNASNAPEATPVPGPTLWPNPNTVYKIAVAQTGVQVVSFSNLPAAPGDLASANWNMRYNDQLLAIIMADVNGNAKFDSGDYIKFYAPYAGDRLNKTTTYWLSYDNAPLAGGRMATVSKPVTNAPVSSYALERRQWITRTLYTSLFAGEDNDHFFAGRTKASSPIPITVPPIAFTLDDVLPPAGGNVSVTLAGIGTTSGAHNGEFTLNGVVKQVTWSGLGAIPASAGMFAIASPPQLSPPGTFQVKAQVGTAVDEVLIEAVKWERPVTLNFGSKGAVFYTRSDGNFTYQLTGLPTGTFFLDVTTPLTPTIMNKDGVATTYQFQDVPGRAYLMEGTGQTWTPTASKHTPSAWANLNKNVLYVAPANLQASLAPLISLRTTQGYQPLAVSLEAIYDAWGYGQISAPAIRNFLRYAASAWAIPPIAVTFVGTSTFDPFSYLGDYGENQFVLPAYLGSVDPFIGETACDTCFASLDEDEAIFANKDAAIFPDLLFGRLPVKTAAELNTLVTKIVGHETAALGSPLNTWRSRIGLVADNYQFEDGHTDGAGNFAAFSEASAKLHPSTIKPTRAYFDLCKPHTPTITLPPCDLQTSGLPGQTTIETMRQSIVNLYNAGQSLIVYNGHGSQTQIGDEKFIEAIDVVKLTNATMLPVVLQMTCFTSQFINNTYQSLDETLLLKANGGAIAIWGATGLGVAHGHDALQSGFLKALWKPTNAGRTGKATVGSAPIGELTLMGYNELALNGGCCQDTIRTFLVLGDPLTSLRMQAPKGMYLPYTRKP
jgi:Peptidase family C25